MKVALWVVQGVLAVMFLFAGGMKLALPRKKLLDSGTSMAWAQDFSDSAVKAIGVAETLGAVGIVLPGLAGVAPSLTLLAAGGLALLMIGAVIAHARRGEMAAVAAPAVLAVLAVFVAVARFGPFGV